MCRLLICLATYFMVGTSGAEAQARRASAPADRPRPAAELTRASVSAAGLTNERTLTSLYLGEFDKIDLERDALLFNALFQDYLDACAVRCKATLPADAVEMTRPVCVREQYPVNRYGGRVGPSYCVAYEQQGRGLYADPALYAVKTQLDQTANGEAVRNVFALMRQANPAGAAAVLASTAAALKRDMDALVGMNRCASPGIRRFQDNLMLFAQGKRPIRLDGEGGTSTATRAPQAARAPAGPFQDSDYTRLLEDLVAEQSKSWAMNRYVGGSMSRVSVANRDEAGRPTRLAGQYAFISLDGRKNQGSVTVDFADGAPQCLYFFDFPAECRAANRRVASAYLNGAYQR